MLRRAVLTLFAVIFIYPFLLSLATSFKSRPEVAAHPVTPWPRSFDLRAWGDVLLHSDFPLWTFNSIVVTVAATLLRVFLDSLAGYALARLDWRGRGVVFAGVVSVLAVPPIVLTVPRFLVLKELTLLTRTPGSSCPWPSTPWASSHAPVLRRAPPRAGGGGPDRRRVHLRRVLAHRPAAGPARPC
ncbi:hypothetical protein GCM10020218_007580 [Dactylosporangium vinaceum]